MKRTKRIQLRVTEEEKKIIEEAAEIEGLSSADFVRKTMLIACKQKSKVQLQRKAKDRFGKGVTMLTGHIRKMGGSVESMTKQVFQNPNLTEQQLDSLTRFEQQFIQTRKIIETLKSDYNKGIY